MTRQSAKLYFGVYLCLVIAFIADLFIVHGFFIDKPGRGLGSLIIVSPIITGVNFGLCLLYCTISDIRFNSNIRLGVFWTGFYLINRFVHEMTVASEHFGFSSVGVGVARILALNVIAALLVQHVLRIDK